MEKRQHPNDPLHGINLERMVTELADHFGWDELGRMIDIRCFNFNPSVQSSLKFLRKTPWARQQVEACYLWFKTSGEAEADGDTPAS